MTCTTERVHVRGWLCRTDRFYHDNILYRINEKDHHEKILPEKKQLMQQTRSISVLTQLDFVHFSVGKEQVC